jgi:hypothetical protein
MRRELAPIGHRIAASGGENNKTLSTLICKFGDVFYAAAFKV